MLLSLEAPFDVSIDSIDRVFIGVGSLTVDMQPQSRTGDTADAESEFEPWDALRLATQDNRANLIADIVGHPEGAPSVAELDYMNPSLTEDAIRKHLQRLQDGGVIEELVVEAGDRVKGYPYKFYRLTEEARALFDKNGLFPQEAWRRQYDRVEKTGEIRDIESMPRP